MFHVKLRLLLPLLALTLTIACGDDAPKTTPTDTADAAMDADDTSPPDTDLDAEDATDDTADDDTPDVPDDPALACDPGGLAPGELVTATLNGWTVRADRGDGSWSVSPPHTDDVVLMASPACVDLDGAPTSSIRLGRGRPSVFAGFGAFQIDLAASSLDWRPITGAPTAVEADADHLAVTFAVAGTPPTSVTLRFAPEGTEHLSVALEAADPEDAAELVWLAAPTDAFFGLGTQVAGMDLRGHTYPLWTQEQGIGKHTPPTLFPLENTLEAAYAPMGVWHASSGYSAIIDHDAFSELDLGRSHADRVALRSFAALPAFVLVAGDTPRARLTAITDFTGRNTAPPPWVFAPWNDAVGGPARLAEVARVLREAHIPSSAIWSEDWIGGDQGPNGYRLSYAWAWDESHYPELPANIADLHASGFAFLGYFNPFVPQPTAMFAEGVAGDFLIKDDDGELITFQDPAFRTASLVDLTNPDAAAWMRGYHLLAAETLGIDGWMADFAEWLPVDARLANGESGWVEHNRYPVRWQNENRANLTEAHQSGDEAANNWIFFARSGWASTSGGTSGAAIAMWGGDQDTDWDVDDGLPTTLPIATHAGLAGVGLFATDIAGYTSVVAPNTTKELFYRWSMIGAFHPIMRTHHGSDECGNWSFDRDAETLAHYRRYATLHTLLYPFFTNLLDDMTVRGWPYLRHPFLVEPDRPGLWEGLEYEVFLGDDLLLAPVLHEGDTTRHVRLPARGWWPLLGDAPLRDADDLPGDVVGVVVDAPVTELPAFVRPGTILPLLMTPVDSFYGATEPDITDLDDAAGAFALALYPDADGTLRTTRVGDGTASGAGFTAAPIDWTSATLDGAALPACASDAPAPPCAHPDGYALIEGTDLTLTVGAATLELHATVTQRYRVALASKAFGAQAAPTAVTDLHPDVPPPCE